MKGFWPRSNIHAAAGGSEDPDSLGVRPTLIWEKMPSQDLLKRSLAWSKGLANIGEWVNDIINDVQEHQTPSDLGLSPGTWTYISPTSGLGGLFQPSLIPPYFWNFWPMCGVCIGSGEEISLKSLISLRRVFATLSFHSHPAEVIISQNISGTPGEYLCCKT